MRLPKYQWLMTEPVQECGFCDNVFVSQNGTGDYQKQIQVQLTTTDVVANQLSANPFDLVTSANLEFTIEFSPVGYQLQLYVEDTIYVFNWTNSIPSGYEYTQIGNIYFVNLYLPVGVFTLSEKQVFENFMNAVFDVNHSTTTSFNTGTDLLTITGIPSGSYISNSDLFPFVSGITTVTASTNVQNWMYWNGSSLCYYSSTITPGEVSYAFEQALTAGSNYIIQIPYQITSLGIESTITIDDGTNPPTTFTPDTTIIGGTIELNYEAVLSSTHTIKIELTDVNGNIDGICFNSITIQEIALIDTVEYEDCDGNITEVDFNTEAYAESYFNGDTYNIVLMDNFPTVFRIIITDTDANVITSRWYQVYNGTDCEYGKLYDIKWTSDCTVGELDYGFTGQINQLYLNGVKIKNQLEVLDSVENVTADGRKRSIYKNTVSQYELRLHPYLASTMDTIERIFDHKTITVDGTQYYVTDVFQVSEVDLGIYTGRVDMYEDGSELIVSDCCC